MIHFRFEQVSSFFYVKLGSVISLLLSFKGSRFMESSELPIMTILDLPSCVFNFCSWGVILSLVAIVAREKIHWNEPYKSTVLPIVEQPTES